MNILGIDLGSNKTAYTHITGGILTPQFDAELLNIEKETDSKKRFVTALSWLRDGITIHQPELVVVEYPFNIKGNASILIEMFGVIRYFCLSKDIAFMGLPQTKIKKYATGNGHAEKSDIRMQLYKEFGLDFSEDMADSFFIAHFGMTYLYGTDKKFRQESVDGYKASLVKESKKKKKQSSK